VHQVRLECYGVCMVRKELLAAVLLSVLAACGPGRPLELETIQTGKSLNSDNSVGTLATRFKPDDTLFVSVLTKGRGAGKIGVKWTYAGRLVSEDSRDVSYRDNAATEFHIKNSGGFPAGDYAVEVLIDGKSVATRPLKVEK
jgi:hypothetical protein